ncbi:DUF5937 family protein [Streptomyces sp. CA-132043]|uniref:ArsR/SmtB family transcription factor n=1 Tax=Streptomyces sp. CA-132043 TaxID=3240048 RepID=UPI003D8D4CFB
MASRLQFGRDDLLKCRFAISPLWETHEAVLTLQRAERQNYHRHWLHRIRGRSAELDLAPLWLLKPRRGLHPDWLCPPPLGPEVAFAEEIAAVRATDPETAREETSRSLAATSGALTSPQGRAWLRNPARMIEDLADLLEKTWEHLLAPEWPRLRAVLDADLSHHSRRLAEVGLGELLPEISPRCAWSAGTLTVECRAEHARHLNGQGLVLLPSVFVWPEVISTFEGPWQPTLAYPARGIAGLWTPPTACPDTALIRLLGHRRARILTALDAPVTTTFLAHQLHLTPSSVSTHLSVLRDAGLATSHRHGRQVLYERTSLGDTLTADDTRTKPTGWAK